MSQLSFGVWKSLCLIMEVREIDNICSCPDRCPDVCLHLLAILIRLWKIVRRDHEACSFVLEASIVIQLISDIGSFSLEEIFGGRKILRVESSVEIEFSGSDKLRNEF